MDGFGAVDVIKEEKTAGHSISTNSMHACENPRSPTPPPDPLRSARERETNAYNNLVKDGGRPLYPIGLLDDISARPAEHRELLRPWWDFFGGSTTYFPHWWYGGGDSLAGGGGWEVFQRQWRRWLKFRMWQKANRDLEDDGGGGFPAYLERQKHYIQRYFTTRAAAEELARIEANPSCVQQGWEQDQEQRKWQRYYCHERDIASPAFSDYVDAAKRRLAGHRFTRPFELNENPEQQGKPETWIEYLYFEYWWLDQFTRVIERLYGP